MVLLFLSPIAVIGVYNNVGQNTVLNNSIVNEVIPRNRDRKRTVADGAYFEFICTGVQGDHAPIWEAEFHDSPGEVVLIGGGNFGYSSTPINDYQTELEVYLQSDYSGVYYCASSISESFIQFRLEAGTHS